MNSIKIIYIYRQRIIGKVHIKILPVVTNQVMGLWEMLIINILSFVWFSIINRPCCLIKKYKNINYFIFWKTTKIQSQSKLSSRILGSSHSSQHVRGIRFAFHTPRIAWACWVGTCEIPSLTYLDWPLPMWISHGFWLYFRLFLPKHLAPCKLCLGWKHYLHCGLPKMNKICSTLRTRDAIISICLS